MPIYEYVCEKCAHHLEIMQKMDDAPLVKCPNCGRKKLEKIFSQTSFQLKGGGWYVNDYGKSGGSGKQEKESASEPTEKKESKDSDSESTEKKESKESASEPKEKKDSKESASEPKEKKEAKDKAIA